MIERPTPGGPSRIPVFKAGRLVFESLVGIATEIEEVIGTDAVLLLLARRGGMKVYVPARVADSALADVIGDDASAAMIAAFGPGELVLPCGHLRGQSGRRTRAMRMLMDGASLRDVSIACDIHTRTITNYRRALRDRDLLPDATDPNT